MSDMAYPFQGNVLITGVTGFIGRHLLYDFVRFLLEHEVKGNIYVLLRGKKQALSSERLDHILKHEYAPEFFKECSEEAVARKVRIIEGSLDDEDLGEKLKEAIPTEEKLYIIHSAGSVNLFNNQQAEQEVNRNNLLGTQNLLVSSRSFNSKFVFISTAFSCGIVKGALLGDDFSVHRNNVFRNPYEHCKNLTEKMIEDYCLENEKEFQILRPSVVCGRLVDTPLYYTSKFDVIYGWTKFFWNLKKQSGTDHVRVAIAPEAKANVVPVDFVSKSVVSLFTQNIPHVNITYPKSLNTRRLYEQMLRTIEFDNYTFVDEQPADLNKCEKIYYRLIDKVYHPYLNHCDNEYDTRVLEQWVDNKYITEVDLPQLTKFATHYDFDEMLIY